MRAIAKRSRLLRSLFFRFSDRSYIRALRAVPIQSGDIVIDLGANVGSITQLLADRGAVVHAFEPHPLAFATLEARLGKRCGLVLHNKAVGTATTRAPLFLNERHRDDPLKFSTGSSLCREKDNLSDDSIEVDVVDICDVIVEHKNIKLIKMDVEGLEYDILDRMFVFNLWERIEYLLCESHHYRHPKFQQRYDTIMHEIAERGLTGRWSLDWM
jgi:FkbM family methyltransferase